MNRRKFVSGASTAAGAAIVSPGALAAASTPLPFELLSSGLAPEQDYTLAKKPDNPEMRESASVWLYDESGAFGFPRGGVEAVAASWEHRDFQANFAFPGGRVLDGNGAGPAASPIGPEGRPNVLGAGSMTFSCVEPFRRWKMVFDGPAKDGPVMLQVANKLPSDGKDTHVRLEAEMTMAAPAWVQDNTADTSKMTKAQVADAESMGLGLRFEQLFRANCRLQVDGKSREFKATGLRIHRKSIRRLEGFYGHVWQSALFPDGRAFGSLIYPPRPDGTPGYNEAFIFQNGRVYKAKVVKAVFINRIVPEGEDVSLELESELGLTRIQGTSCLSTFMVNNPRWPNFSLQQGGVRYGWDGQSAYGMIERSVPRDLSKTAA
jgi:hypothetical protein